MGSFEVESPFDDQRSLYSNDEVTFGEPLSAEDWGGMKISLSPEGGWSTEQIEAVREIAERIQTEPIWASDLSGSVLSVLAQHYPSAYSELRRDD